jgi:hypothetical protein
MPTVSHPTHNKCSIPQEVRGGGGYVFVLTELQDCRSARPDVQGRNLNIKTDAPVNIVDDGAMAPTADRQSTATLARKQEFAKYNSATVLSYTTSDLRNYPR